MEGHNEELLEKWKEAVDRYEKATNTSLAPLTFDQMTTRSQEMFHSNKDEIFKKVASTAFQVAKFAASTASAAAPIVSPASTVFVALSALGDTAERYRHNFTRKHVLEQVQSVNGTLVRMRDYMEDLDEGVQIDAALQTSIFHLFTDIIALCQIYATVEKDSTTFYGTIKSLLKAAIGSDGGIQERLDNIREQTDLQLNNNIAALRRSDLHSSTSKALKANLNKLGGLLNVGRNDLPWTDGQKRLENNNIPGMGKWLLRLPNMVSWLDSEHHTDTPVLALQAEPGHGKSHLCSQIIHKLKKRQEGQGRKRIVHVAWYYFQDTPGLAKSSGLDRTRQRADGKEHSRLVEALSALIWQLAENDSDFLRYSVKELSKAPHIGISAVDLWTRVVMGYMRSSVSENNKPQRIFYLVIDGYGKLGSGDKLKIQRITDDISKFRDRPRQIRLLWSDSRKLITENVEIISLDSQNLDIEVFIRHHLDPPNESWNQDNQVQTILLEIRTRLFVESDGNYHSLAIALQDIKRSAQEGLSSLQQFKGEDTDYSSVSIRQKLQTLSKELDSDGVAVLNELILCLAYWKAWPTVDQLNGYLVLRHGSKLEQPIGSLLEEKFERLASIQKDTQAVKWAHEKFFENLKETMRYPIIDQRTEEHRWSLTASVGLSRGLQHFPRMLSCAVEIGQDDFTQPRVYIDPLGGRVDVIISLLEVACYDNLKGRPEARGVNEYTATWLTQHFGDISDQKLKEIPKEKREKIGGLLNTFFTEEQVVESWIPKGDVSRYLSEEWETALQDVLRWLKDVSVVRGFRQKANAQAAKERNAHRNTSMQPLENFQGTEDRKADGSSTDEAHWVDDKQYVTLWAHQRFRSFLRICSPDITLYDLLDVPMKVAASQWLEEFKWGASQAFELFVNIYHEVLYSRSADFLVAKQRHPKFREISDTQQQIDLIIKAKDWAEAILDMSESQMGRNQNHDIRLAETFLAFSSPAVYGKAEYRCRLVLRQDPLNITAARYLSHALEKTNRTQKALEELMSIRTIIQSSKFQASHEDTWKAELKRFWDLCTITGDSKKAFIACRDLSEEFLEEGFPSQRAFEWIMKKEELDGNFEILSVPRKNGCSFLAKLFLRHADSEEFHQKFYLAPNEHAHILSRTYEDAIRIAASTAEKARLRYYHGMALDHQGQSTEAQKTWVKSIDDLKASQEWDSNDRKTFEIFSRVTETLASKYLDAMGQKEPTHSPDDYVRRMEGFRDFLNKQRSNEVSYFNLLLARAYLITGHPRKAVAAVENNFSRALDLLNDGRTDNDWEGYHQLAQILTVLDDDENAKVAWSLLVNDPDEERTYKLGISCAGECAWTWLGPDKLKKEIQVCRDCPRVHFETDCFNLLKNNTLEKKICSANHRFLRIRMRRPQDVKLVNNGKIRLRDLKKNEMSMKDWEKSIRIKYGIPNKYLSSQFSKLEKLRITGWKTKRRMGIKPWRLRRKLRMKN